MSTSIGIIHIHDQSCTLPQRPRNDTWATYVNKHPGEYATITSADVAIVDEGETVSAIRLRQGGSVTLNYYDGMWECVVLSGKWHTAGA
jgi:hypothetical protein